MKVEGAISVMENRGRASGVAARGAYFFLVSRQIPRPDHEEDEAKCEHRNHREHADSQVGHHLQIGVEDRNRADRCQPSAQRRISDRRLFRTGSRSSRPGSAS